MVLRPVREDDLDLLARMYEPELAGPYAWSGYVSPVRFRRRFAEDGYLGPDDGQLLVELPDGPVVGNVGWHAVHHGPPPASRCWNIGIGLLPEWRGRGLGTTAQRLLAAYLLENTTVNRIEASTDVTNHAEQRALEKAGFTREAVLRGAQFREGGWHDMVVFSRLRGD